jgi:WD40 repeat protein
MVPLTEKPGDRIGRYKLLEQIGEGGCGVVYVAEQEQPVRRRVALKVIKLGMDTRQVIARFEAERQALALMDHPNIAKVLDGGATETGRPFFVMELVKGVRITDYCDKNNLSTTERLGLFVQVCHAIQHAHQKGIIHRDIKPSNVLVTLHDGVPVPKVIDFGIAKATTDQRLTDKTLYTAIEQFIGTPAYMSPEQAELSGLDIDTRSDIYGLGVLLYELLTGKTPFDAMRLVEAGLDEIRRIIREEDPPRPSTRISTLDAGEQTAIAKRRHAELPKLLGLIRGDLDWIVMKTLEKDRTRRYETANGLAADIQRHLHNQPVVARPPTAAYQLMKFARRHKAGLAVASVIAGMLLAGVVVSSWLAVRATRAEAQQSALLKQKEQARLEAERQRRQALESEDRALSVIYAIDMQAVQQAIGNGLLDQARSLLTTHLPRPDQRDRRGFEWFYYAHLAKGQHTAVLLEQTNRFISLAATPDGKMLALLDPDEIKAFDLSQRKVVQRWPRMNRHIGRISISPDGQWIALGTTNDLVVLNITTGQTTAFAAGRAGVISFAPNRPWIALARLIAFAREGQSIGEEGQVRIWDYQQRRLLHSFPDAYGPLLWWETNSTVLAGVNHAGTLQRWDVVTGARIQAVLAPLSQNEDTHYAGAIAAQGVRGVLDSRPDRMSVFDPADGRILCESPWSGALSPMTGLALSADGRFVAGGDLACIRLAETDHLEAVESLAGHLKNVRGIAFVGTSSNLVSCGEDGRLLLWERKPPFTITFTPDTNATHFFDRELVLSADERFCAANGEVWSLPGGNRVRNHPGTFLGFSPTSEEFVTESDGELRIWKCAESGTNSARAFLRPTNGTVTESFGMKLSTDGRFLACNIGFTNILVFQARTGHLLASAAEHPPPAWPEDHEILAVQFLPTSQRLLAELSHGGAIWDWQSPTNSEWIPLPGEPYGVSGDGRWLALRDESGRRLKLVETETGQKIRVELEGHRDRIGAIAFSHDGQTLASLDLRSELRLWKLPEGRLVGVKKVAADVFGSLAFAIDDQRLYISGMNGIEVLEAPRTSQGANQLPVAKARVLAVPSDSIWAR